MANRIRIVNNKAQAFVEFAFSITVLMLFVFGIFEVGRLFHMKIALANASREGARYLIRHVSDADPEDPGLQPFEKTKNAAVNEANNYGITITPDDVDVSCDVHQHVCRSGREVEVTISVEATVGIVSQLFGNINLTETAIMRAP